MQISSLLFASFAVLAVAKNGDSEPTDLAQLANMMEASTTAPIKQAKETAGAVLNPANSTASMTGGSGKGSGGKKSGNSTKTGAAGVASPTGGSGPAKNGTPTATARPVQATGGAVAFLAQSGGYVTVAGLGVVFAVFM